ncbi:MAG TPA: hypothetical protein VIR05_03265 [Luteimonas sp.]
MSWLALLLVPLALYAAYKLVGVALKLVLAVVVVVAVYWWAAPQMGWPTVSDLVYVFGPDLDGRRIEEVADPSRLAGEAAERMTDRVVDEVVERSGFAQPEAEPPLPDAGMQAEPETHDTRPAPPL